MVEAATSTVGSIGSFDLYAVLWYNADMDWIENFLAARTSGEITLMAFFAAIMLFASGIFIGRALGMLAG